MHADAAWSGPAVDGALRTADLDPRDRAFAANLAYSTLRWQGTLDWALSRVVTRPLEQVEPEVADVLRLGAWQLLYGHAPDRAVVDTAVQLVRAEIGERPVGFVNGVLRSLARKREQLPWPSADDDNGIGLRRGYPEAVVVLARQRFGERMSAVLEAGNEPPGLTLRTVGSPQDVRAELIAGGHDPQPGRWAPEALRLAGVDPADLAAVQDGRAVVQDEASMLVARALVAGIPSGARVLDVCAAPGGKSTHLAQLGARVTAADLRQRRARQVTDAAARSGLERQIAVAVADGARPPWRSGAFEGVLLDAPCSGFGVVRRRPELRWRRSDDDVRRLAVLQLSLLESCAELVAAGGALLYSVCTWTAAETVDVVEQFLALHGDRFDAEDAAVAIAGAGTRLRGDPGIQLAPDLDGTDGMYLCRLRRRPASDRPPGTQTPGPQALRPR